MAKTKGVDASVAVAGLAYGSIVFVIGFVLGSIRVLVIAPRIGATAATLAETPILLAASWPVALSCIRRFEVAATRRARLAMGGVAFATLLCAEFGLAVVLFGRSPADFVAVYFAPPGAIGLAAQIVFAALPAVEIGLRRSQP